MKTWFREPLTESQRWWVAAVIDCEGMITITMPWNRLRNNRNLVLFSRVEMITKAVPSRLFDLCAGYFGPVKYRFEGTTRRDKFRWQIHSNGLRWLLPQILDCLLVKRRQAEIALKILENNRKGRFLPKMPFDELRQLTIEMRQGNAKGRKPDLSLIIPRTSERLREVCDSAVLTAYPE